MKNAPTTTTESFELTQEDSLLLQNLFSVHKRPSSDLTGIYVVPNMVPPSLRDKVVDLFSSCAAASIELSGWKFYRSEYNGSLYAKKSGLISKLMQ